MNSQSATCVWVMLIVIISLLTGCNYFSPAYQKPDVNPPQTWQNAKQSEIKKKQTKVAQLKWWRRFNSPILNKLVQKALIHNNQLKSASADIAQAKAQLKAVDYSWWPTVDIGATAFEGQVFDPSFSTANNFDQTGHDERTHGHAISLIPSYELNVLKQLNAGKIADLNIALKKEIKKAVRLAVIKQTVFSYVSLAGAKRQYEIQKKGVELARKLRQQIRLRHQSGAESPLKSKALSQLIAKLKSRLPKIEHDITKLENALKVLTDQNPGSVKLKRHFQQLAAKQKIPIQLPAEVLKNRPDVAISEYRLKINNANIGLSRSDLFPSIKLTGHLGDASTTLNNLFSASASFWLLAAGLDMPVFDMSTLAKIDKAEAQYQKSLKQYMQTVKRSFADVENALSKNKRYRERMHSRDQAVQYAKDQIDIQKIKLKSGASRPSELLLTQLNRNQALAQYNQAKIKKMQALVGVYKALGAGSEVSMKNAQDQ